MIENLAEFQFSVRKFAGATEHQVLVLKKRLAFGIYRRCVLRSPVDTGYFRANWNLSAGTPDLTLQPEGKSSYRQQSVGASAYKRLSHAKAEDDLWVANATRYGIFLEHGHSKQAPQGVLALSVLEELSALREAA